MSEKIKLLLNTFTRDEDRTVSARFMASDEVRKARSFHESFREYEVTPLVALDSLAKRLNLKGIYVKDESYRFGLNAFKVLGGSYAMGSYLAQKVGKDISELPYDRMVSDEVREAAGDVTFVTATDGNHGRGVAWTANRLKQKSVVYMPKGSSEIRLKNIQAEGADASITDMNYDDAVRLAAKYADEHNGLVVQDTAWEGYTDIPTWIMQGYATMALEAKEQLMSLGVERPTHIFIQAGVGSLAGAVQGFFAMEYPDDVPVTTVVEPDEAACYYLSAKEGRMSSVGGDMQTIMAGLACGEPNKLGFDIIRNYSTAFLSCPDYVAADGMRVLGNPLGKDTRVISGESGAVTLGALYRIMTDEHYAEYRKNLKLDENSRVLLFSTEGDTDPKKYREIVWLGHDSELLQK
ncbi:diaminopropionate ammonia-lyase [Youngiibacter fragilis]|uniref:Diaminopropionate ammonia-lyase n=1 Tax=Youngiibacter fragilis 232.1 TaxID=994573 RepID=V7I3M3_9CLOT|nr:diaminopropionate ammonia-lyase [Youngiibacter fragilis]ETA79784.1 diaminopropionate ammonia-lyase [Youngiibacter fragilis 232.1]